MIYQREIPYVFVELIDALVRGQWVGHEQYSPKGLEAEDLLL
jgi:hypothetical protein